MMKYNKVTKLWIEGYSNREISQKLGKGYSYGTVSKIIRELGLIPNRVHDTTGQPINNIKLFKLYIEGYTYKDIATQMGITEKNVYEKVHHHRLEARGIVTKSKLDTCESCGEIYTNWYRNRKTCPNCLTRTQIKIATYKTICGIRSNYYHLKNTNPKEAKKLLNDMKYEEGEEFVKLVLGEEEL